MPFELDTVKQIAHLARLDIETKEGNCTIQEDLNRIMPMIDQIVAANTQGIDPMAHPLHMQQPLRKDYVTENNQRDTLLTLAPKAEAGLYLVPIVIE